MPNNNNLKLDSVLMQLENNSITELNLKIKNMQTHLSKLEDAIKSVEQLAQNLYGYNSLEATRSGLCKWASGEVNNRVDNLTLMMKDFLKDPNASFLPKTPQVQEIYSKQTETAIQYKLMCDKLDAGHLIITITQGIIAKKQLALTPGDIIVEMLEHINNQAQNSNENSKEEPSTEAKTSEKKSWFSPGFLSKG